MASTAKIHLSKEERDLVTNKEWILTKHRITKKVFEIFGEISEQMKKEIGSHTFLFPENIKDKTGKISKGENYQLLPYVILDYPSFFWKDNIFAIRTMFWWGNFFSITLHLSGNHKVKFVNDTPDLFSFLQKKNFSICINDEEWEHTFEEENYIDICKISMEKYQAIIEKKFFKIAKKLSLTEWDNAENFIMESLKEIIELLQTNYQGGKKDLLPVFPTVDSGL